MTDNRENQAESAQSLAAWVEPEIRSLDIGETSLFSRRGADGGRFVDCTRS